MVGYGSCDYRFWIAACLLVPTTGTVLRFERPSTPFGRRLPAHCFGGCASRGRPSRSEHALSSWFARFPQSGPDRERTRSLRSNSIYPPPHARPGLPTYVNVAGTVAADKETKGDKETRRPGGNLTKLGLLVSLSPCLLVFLLVQPPGIDLQESE